MTTQSKSALNRSYLSEGGRTGFLLIHGLGGTPVELRFVAQALARSGYTVSCPQLAGHCATAEDLRRSTWQEWAQSVSTAYDELKLRCDVVVAGGLSMGGILAANLALERPGALEGLIFYAPTLKLDGWSMPWYSLPLRWIRPTRLNLPLTVTEREPYGLKDERVRALVVQHMQSGDASQAGMFSTPMRALAHFNAMVAVVKPRLPEIKLPALVMHPRDDDMASIGNAIHLQRKLGGRVDMVVLEDSYHMITLDRQRQVVIDRTLSFARSIEEGVAGRASLAALRVTPVKSTPRREVEAAE